MASRSAGGRATVSQQTPVRLDDARRQLAEYVRGLDPNHATRTGPSVRADGPAGAMLRPGDQSDTGPAVDILALGTEVPQRMTGDRSPSVRPSRSGGHSSSNRDISETPPAAVHSAVQQRGGAGVSRETRAGLLDNSACLSTRRANRSTVAAASGLETPASDLTYAVGLTTDDPDAAMGSPTTVPAPVPAAVAVLGLPPRLAQTLAGLLAGLSEKQVARDLSLSPHTVHTYVKQLHKRLGVASRGELLARFIRSV
ncbi:MAG: LuxR C-terminal-related transcriptional regulator [Tepidisphaeraceae bacterium]